ENPAKHSIAERVNHLVRLTEPECMGVERRARTIVHEWPDKNLRTCGAWPRFTRSAAPRLMGANGISAEAVDGIWHQLLPRRRPGDQVRPAILPGIAEPGGTVRPAGV